MNGYSISLLKPADCSREQLEQFHDLVIAGGQVQPEGLAERIASAALLAFSYSGEQLTGVASIKNQKRSYFIGIFLKAKVPRLAENYQFEIGYAVTHENFRRLGISCDLIIALPKIKSGTHFYATTKNNGMCDQLGYTADIDHLIPAECDQ